MKRKEQIKQPPILPREQITFEKNTPWGKVFRKKYTGKITGEKAVVYSLSFPDSESEAFGEIRDLLGEILENYLLFLEEKSQNTEEDLFGGLSFSVEEDGFLLIAALCPLAERRFRPVARFTLTPEGSLQSVRKIRRTL